MNPTKIEWAHCFGPGSGFIGSMGDIYDPNVPQEWRDRVWAICVATPQHLYFVLTKQPQNMRDLQHIPNNVRIGFSCQDQATFNQRADALCAQPYSAGPMMVSCEPLLGQVTSLFPAGIYDWVIVGAQSGPGAFVPPAEWVDRIVDEARKRGCAVFVKDSLRAMYPERDWPQEWPDPDTIP